MEVSVFESIVGQETVTRTLEDMFRSGRVPHALLFAGPYGVGKVETAFDFARALLCEHPETAPCGSCGPCRRVERFEHPDLHVLFPFRAPPQKADAYGKWVDELNEHRNRIATSPYVPVSFDKGRDIVVKLADEVRDRLMEHSFEGGRRICIIVNSERLNKKTGNMFLKIIEEPPPGVHFILTAERPMSVLPTIRSRSSVLRFRRLTTTEIAGALERVGVDDPALRDEAATLGEGSLKAAREFVLTESAEQRAQAFELYAQVALGDEGVVVAGTMPYVRSWDFALAEELIYGFIQYTRLVFETVVGIEPAAGRFTETVRTLARHTERSALDRLASRLEECLDMAGRNVAVPFVISTALYDIHDTYRTVSE